LRSYRQRPLDPLVGKNVGDTKVFDHPTMKSRLAAAKGKDAALVRERLRTAGNVMKEGSIVAGEITRLFQPPIKDASST
jgi:hypothetical protein